MAAKLYGGAYLSSFVNAVLDNLSLILEDDYCILNGNHSAIELLERLQNCLYDVAPVLDDAELKQFTDKRVKKWLVDLQDALYFADDLLDELSTKAATQRDPGECQGGHVMENSIHISP
ncbi:putative disease resistance protein RGA1 [Arachis stenosperma]|uniref:putative disease resistance protein RGA1 n=1 Tax=Arachis stenosperma TaxID=217475 RepID=UPI0025AB6E67|nr:putative disease resistance protein RGA1 [Arachis stenosperma]